MALIRCPICGEKFSDTYRECPFCQEEEALHQGIRLHRGGKRLSRRQQPSVLSPILFCLILIMVALLAYLLYGDQIQEKFSELFPDYASDIQTPALPEEDGPQPEQNQLADLQALDPTEFPETLVVTLQNEPVQTFTVTVGDAPVQLAVAENNSQLYWRSSDSSVATVDASSGMVSAISEGEAVLTVHNGTSKGSCTVAVKEAGPDVSAAALNKTDFTLPIGDDDVQLRVSGVSTDVSWSSSNPSVATVSSTGMVKAIGAGTATVTASFEGGSLTCIVRVRG